MKYAGWSGCWKRFSFIETHLMKTREKCAALISKLYPGVTFRDSALNKGIERRLEPGGKVLDVGCGRDAPIAGSHAKDAGLAVGIDMVREFQPPEAVEIVRADMNELPFADETFDLVFSRSVLEHLLEPELAFKEVGRILKKGGGVIMATPNKYDYASVLARIIPDSLHGRFLRTGAGDEVYDDFPTRFRCNTRKDIEKSIGDTRLRLKSLAYIRHYPYYLMFSMPLFYLGVAYDRMITKLGFDFLQPTILFELEKN